MKKSITFFCLSMLLPPSSSMVQAQWKQLYVGGAGGINAIAVSGLNVLAGTNTGIFRSTNSGSSWTNVNSNFTLCFTARGSNIFAGTTSGLVLSTDNGSTWATSNSSFTYYVTALAVKDTDIFAGTYQNGIVRSTDNGVTWSPVDSGLGAYQDLVRGLEVNDSDIFAATAGGLCLSTNNGVGWTTVALPFQNASATTNCVAVHDSTILVGTPGGMFRSTDGGNIWRLANGFSNTTSIFSIAVDSPYTYTGTVNGVYQSTDDGQNWNPINNGLPGDQVLSVAANGSNLYAGTISNGVYLSTNNGTGWTSINNGIISSSIYPNSITGYGHNVFSVINGSSLFTSTDDGTTWLADTTLPSSAIQSIAVFDSALFAVTNNGIYISLNNGASWDSINGGIMDTLYPTMITKSGSNFIVTTQYRGLLFMSSDNGASWIADTVIPRVASLISTRSEVLAGSYVGLFVSTDNGRSWAETKDTLTDINAMAASGAYIFSGRYHWPFPVGGIPTPPGAVFRSTDYGKSWSSFDYGLPSYPGAGPQVHALAIHGSNVFAGLDPGYNTPTFYVSTIYQNNWVDVGAGLPTLPVYSIFVNDSDIFIGLWSGGLWRRTLSQITAVKQPPSSIGPMPFKLEQNYPNPFNPSTTISYQLSAISRVTLKIYDVLGRELARLVNGVENPGRYEIRFDGSHLSSGLYFYQLRVTSQDGNGFVSTKKLMLVK